jgi:hypothetical protein
MPRRPNSTTKQQGMLILKRALKRSVYFLKCFLFVPCSYKSPHLFISQVLQLVCKTCGKPCRSETEKQLHMKRNPGHNEFVDQTAVAAGPVDYTIEKDDHMDLDEDTKRAIAAATGKDPDAIAKAAADAAPKEDGPKERVTEKVNKELMTQLIDMGFPDVRAEKGLWLTGNESLENAINWLAEHSEDADIDIPLEIDPASAKVESIMYFYIARFSYIF